MRKVVSGMLGLALLSLSLPTDARAQPAGLETPAPVAIRNAIAAIVAEQDTAWNNGDAKSYVQRMLPEAHFTNIVGSYFPDRDAFMKNMSDLFAGLFKGSVNHQTIQSIRLITPDVAVVDTISALGGLSRIPVGAEAVGGVMHSRPEMVMVKRADGWWIASFHNVTINPRFLPPELVTPAR